MATNTVRLHRVLRAPPGKVYRAFLDADAMSKWLPPHGFTAKVHHLDARIGGTYRMSFANFSSGNLARSIPSLRQDKTKNLDFSLFKNFHIKERYQVAFRAEAFNLTNTPVFGFPGTTINGANFGIITSQSNPPRNLQFALKFIF